MKLLKIELRGMTRNGFSLIELVVVIAIITILAAIAGLSMRSWLGKSSAEEQVKQMYTDCVNARTRAMNRNRIHFVEIILPNQYRIWEDTNTPPDGDGTLQNIVPPVIPGFAAGGDTLLMRKNTTENFTPAGQFTFDTKGQISPNGTVRILSSFNPAVDCISLSATRIRLGRWDGANCISQ